MQELRAEEVGGLIIHHVLILLQYMYVHTAPVGDSWQLILALCPQLKCAECIHIASSPGSKLHVRICSLVPRLHYLYSDRSEQE